MSSDRRPPANPPGRAQLDYRVGTFEEFAEAMIDRLAVALGTREESGPGRPPGGRAIFLNLSEQDHWLVGLVKSWATVADVLTFYQERLVQEGYLRTAVEERSVHALARMVAYRPQVAVAGSAELAVMVGEVKGLPREITIPAGLVVRSVPPPGADPQVFETTEPLVARTAWNLLHPDPAVNLVPPPVRGEDTTIDLAGTATGLGPGSAVALLGRVGGSPVAAFRRLEAATVVPGEPPITRASWSVPLVPEASGSPLAGVELFAFRQEGRLFGGRAVEFGALPAGERKRLRPPHGGVLVAGAGGFRSHNAGLPATATITCLAVDGDGGLYAGTATDGVYRSPDGGRSWEEASRGLAQREVRALVTTPEGSLFAGTAGGGVYRSTDGAEIWEPASGRVTPASPQRRLLRPAPPPTERLPATTVRALVAVRPAGRTEVYAGTDTGIFRSRDAGGSWHPVNRGLPGTDPASGTTDLPISSLAAGVETLYAGTGRGVFASRDGGERWYPINRGLPGTHPFTGFSTTAILALAVAPDRQEGDEVLVAGTARGLYRLYPAGGRWEPTGRRPEEPGEDAEILALVAHEDKVVRQVTLLAGTTRGAWRSTDLGQSWVVERLDASPPVHALAIGPEGAPVVVATPFAELAGEWPDFRIRGGEIDIDGTVPGLVPGSLVALEPDGVEDPTAVGIYRVEGVSRLERRDFGLEGPVTRLRVEPDEKLESFDLRRTRVHMKSAPVALATREQLELGPALRELRGRLLALGDPARRVIVRGDRPPQHLEETVGDGGLAAVAQRLDTALDTVEPDTRVTLILHQAGPGDGGKVLLEREMNASEVAELLGALAGDPAAPGELRLAFTGVGEEGAAVPAALAAMLDAGTVDEEVMRTLAKATSPGAAPLVVALSIVESPVAVGMKAGEVAEALISPQAVTRRADGTTLLHLPVAGSGETVTLLATTVAVHGNVVAATEGRTVADEVLGDGDASRPNQSFVLAAPPNFRRGAPDPEPTVEVRVHGQRWEEVSELHLEDGDSRVYRLDMDHVGRGRVIFGNGEEGARLPTGRGNVTTSYLTGTSTRRVPAGALNLLETRPLGLDSVTNSAPTVAGTPREGRDEVRRRAPQQVRTLGRIVSLRDYEDFARSYTGVAKAGVWELVAAGSRLVQITLAAPGGAPLGAASPLYDDLVRAIEELRCAGPPVTVQDHVPVEVTVTARLRVAASRRFLDVRRAVSEQLLERFGFAASRFRGTLAAAAVVSTIQHVPGVVAVDLERLAWSDGTGDEALGEGRERTARDARWDRSAGHPRPAELVYLSTVDLLPMETP